MLRRWPLLPYAKEEEKDGGRKGGKDRKWKEGGEVIFTDTFIFFIVFTRHEKFFPKIYIPK